MRRSATLLGVLMFVVALPGCKGNKANEAPAQTSLDQIDYYAATTPAEVPATYDPYEPQAVSDQPGDTYASTTVVEPLPSASQTRYHTVAKKDTLYSLARRYYGDQRRWKDIFAANHDQLSDPNKIFVGQRLVIP